MLLCKLSKAPSVLDWLYCMEDQALCSARYSFADIGLKTINLVSLATAAFRLSSPKSVLGLEKSVQDEHAVSANP